MIRSELDAAGVHDPALRDAYRQCRMLNAEHGKTFFLATRLLAPEQRPAVHALYGFARRADDILDEFDDTLTVAERGERLQELATQLFNQLVQNQDYGDDPTLRAVVHTARRYDIPWEMFDDFLTSMRMDLTVTDYPDRTALERYMHGSAEVIGLQMLPVLGTVCSREEAAPYAAALGKAFQLTNFLRDVDEDLQRGRVYLPADELAAYRVDRDTLAWCHANKRTDKRVRRALIEQHAATRRVYEFARKGIEMLDERSRPCVASAYTLYSEILDRIESMDFAIFNQRATVGTARRLQVAGIGVIKAWRARRNHGTKI
jgi:phytoene synthase